MKLLIMGEAGIVEAPVALQPAERPATDGRAGGQSGVAVAPWMAEQRS
jgi:hypothetical protein